MCTISCGKRIRRFERQAPPITHNRCRYVSPANSRTKPRQGRLCHEVSRGACAGRGPPFSSCQAMRFRRDACDARRHACSDYQTDPIDRDLESVAIKCLCIARLRHPNAFCKYLPRSSSRPGVELRTTARRLQQQRSGSVDRRSYHGWCYILVAGSERTLQALDRSQ
jgi:hypothetical protein